MALLLTEVHHIEKVNSLAQLKSNVYSTHFLEFRLFYLDLCIGRFRVDRLYLNSTTMIYFALLLSIFVKIINMDLQFDAYLFGSLIVSLSFSKQNLIYFQASSIMIIIYKIGCLIILGIYELTI